MTAEFPTEETALVSQHLNEIIPGLFCGDIIGAQDSTLLKEKGITKVMSILRGPVNIAQSIEPSNHLQIEMDDLSSSLLLPEIPPAVKWLESSLKEFAEKGEGKVLVHCQAGMSRSSAIVMAYVMKTEKVGLEEAYTMVKEARPCAEPSQTFLKQLRLFECAKWSVDPAASREIRDFYLQRSVDQVLNGPTSIPVSSQHFAPSETQRQPQSPIPNGMTRKLRCGSCRMILGQYENVIHIKEEIGGPAVPAAMINPLLPKIPKQILASPKCSGYFLEPMDWMATQIAVGETQGKLLCPNPKCVGGKKLGNFDWSGVSCGCGVWVGPGFCLSRAKVDEIIV